MTDTERLYEITRLSQDALKRIEDGRSAAWIFRKIAAFAEDGCVRQRNVMRYLCMVVLALASCISAASVFSALAFLIEERLVGLGLSVVTFSLCAPAAWMLYQHLKD